MKIIFLAGPFRGNGTWDAKKANVETARRYVQIFIEKEIPFYSPHLNIDQELETFGANRTEYAIKTNHAFLERCDALAVLPGWESSSGTKKEIEDVQKASKNIFYLENEHAISQIISFLRS